MLSEKVELNETADIVVGKGQIQLSNLTLNPSSNFSEQPWQLELQEASGDPKQANNLQIEFNKNSTVQQQQVERAVLVIEMAQTEDASHDWRFALEGVRYNVDYQDFYNEISTQISPDGRTLTMTIHNTGITADENTRFSFVALRTNNQTGESIIFESQDPSIGIGRAKG